MKIVRVTWNFISLLSLLVVFWVYPNSEPEPCCMTIVLFRVVHVDPTCVLVFPQHFQLKHNEVAPLAKLIGDLAQNWVPLAWREFKSSCLFNRTGNQPIMHCSHTSHLTECCNFLEIEHWTLNWKNLQAMVFSFHFDGRCQTHHQIRSFEHVSFILFDPFWDCKFCNNNINGWKHQQILVPWTKMWRTVFCQDHLNKNQQQITHGNPFGGTQEATMRWLSNCWSVQRSGPPCPRRSWPWARQRVVGVQMVTQKWKMVRSLTKTGWWL